MNKLFIYMLLIVFFMSLYALQADEELGMNTFFEMKHGVNRASHAAAQQVDPERLARGIPDIDERSAKDAALRYLQENLRLDDRLQPLPGTFLRQQVEILSFDVIHGEGHSFPYVYQNANYNYQVTFYRPGVVLILKIEYPRTFGVMSPVTWIVKSSSELVM